MRITHNLQFHSIISEMLLITPLFSKLARLYLFWWKLFGSLAG
jgi:hypothetical protein